MRLFFMTYQIFKRINFYFFVYCVGRTPTSIVFILKSNLEDSASLNHMKYIILLSIFFLSASTVLGQSTIEFGVYHGDKSIGNITITKKQENGLTHYQLHSEVKYETWVYDYNRTSIIKVAFDEDKLVSARSKVIEGGDLDEHTKTTLKGNGHYFCEKLIAEESFKLEDNIATSCASLYFNEPRENMKVFSETYQQLFTIDVLDNHAYEVEFPGSKSNRYYYENGDLQKVEVDRRWFTITFKRQKS